MLKKNIVHYIEGGLLFALIMAIILNVGLFFLHNPSYLYILSDFCRVNIFRNIVDFINYPLNQEGYAYETLFLIIYFYWFLLGGFITLSLSELILFLKSSDMEPHKYNFKKTFIPFAILILFLVLIRIPVFLSEQSLFIAIGNKNYGLVESLLKKGANVNAVNLSSNDTALSWAAYNGDIKMVELLLKYGADPNKVDTKNDCMIGAPLIAVCRRGHENLEIAELLLKNDANPDINWRGGGPLSIAIPNQNINMVKLLIKYKANVNAIDCNGYNLLFSAFRSENQEEVSKSKEIINILFENGFNLVNERQRYYSSTALDMALLRYRKIDPEIIALLRKYGAKTNTELEKEEAKNSDKTANDTEDKK